MIWVAYYILKRQLQKQASQGGGFIIGKGNHEIMNLKGDKDTQHKFKRLF